MTQVLGNIYGHISNVRLNWVQAILQWMGNSLIVQSTNYHYISNLEWFRVTVGLRNLVVLYAEEFPSTNPLATPELVREINAGSRFILLHDAYIDSHNARKVMGNLSQAAVPVFQRLVTKRNDCSEWYFYNRDEIHEHINHATSVTTFHPHNNPGNEISFYELLTFLVPMAADEYLDTPSTADDGSLIDLQKASHEPVKSNSQRAWYVL